jgi:geranylgeranyl pyrophosphate synthase
MTRGPARGLEAPDPALEEQIRAGLDQVETALEKAVRADYELLGEAASYILAAGGKRFRAMLVLLSACFGDPTDPRLVQGCVAIELTHVATLYHDDVMDEAEFRHGVPSVNTKWDNSVAILSGDFLFAKASELSADLGAEITRLLARTIATVCDGQIRDVTTAGSLAQTQDGYMETIRRKTAALIATSCRLGGMLSEAPPDQVDVLERFGELLGLGFQLSDDIMDVISSDDVLGKPPGQDLRQGVYTLPVIYALQDGPRGRELADLLEAGPPEGERLERALQLVASDGSLGRAREAVTAEVRRARTLAEALPPGAPRDALLHLAEYLAARCGAAS